MPADGYESKIDVVVTEAPRLLDDGDHLGSTLTIAPTVLEMDRAVAMMATGNVLRRPAMLVNVPSLADPTIAPDGRHVLSIEVLLTPYRRPGGWAGSAEPQRWLEVFAGRCVAGFLDTIVDWRAVTPDVYEREFHLPAGHAASFGGGPLAAFRNRDPELTRYETAVPGLYLTGAATFPGAGIWGASGRNCATVVLAGNAPVAWGRSTDNNAHWIDLPRPARRRGAESPLERDRHRRPAGGGAVRRARLRRRRRRRHRLLRLDPRS